MWISSFLLPVALSVVVDFRLCRSSPRTEKKAQLCCVK